MPSLKCLILERARLEKRILQPRKGAKPVGAYSQAVKVKGDYFIFISGQVPIDSEGSLVGKGDIRAQTRQVFENIKAVLEESGGSLENIVKLTTFLKNIEDYKAFAEIRSQYLKKDLPASTLMAIKELVNRDWLVEVEAVAVL